MPEGRYIACLFNSYAIATRLVHAPMTQFCELQPIIHLYCRSYVTTQDTCLAHFNDGIEVFLSRHRMINPWYGLVDNPPHTTLITQKVIYGSKHLNAYLGSHFTVHHKSTVCKSSMRAQLVTMNSCRKQCYKHRIPAIVFDLRNHQRTVSKTVAVITHITTLQKKRGILSLCHKSIPFHSIIISVSSNCNHPLYFKKSSYS